MLRELKARKLCGLGVFVVWFGSGVFYLFIVGFVLLGLFGRSLEFFGKTTEKKGN